MSAPSEPSHAAVLRRTGLIVTGMVIYVFIAMHLTNLTIGLKSVAAMDAWSPWLTGLWSGPLSYVLLLCLLVHFGLAMTSLYARNSLNVPTYDIVQIVAGALIIPLLAPHVTGIIAAEEIGATPSYAYLLPYFWNTSPGDGLRQVLLLAVAWLHGSIGVFTWMRARPATRRFLVAYYPLVVMLPTLALLGYVEAGRQVLPPELGGSGLALAQVQAAYAAVVPVSPERLAAVLAAMATVNRWLIWGSLALVAAVLVARWVRVRGLPRDRQVRVIYSGAQPGQIVAGAGLTLLELTREHSIPHAGICRGRGRCGTCRVRVLHSDSALAPPDVMEAKTLARIGASADMRLACQIVPRPGLLQVERVVSPDYSNLDTAEALPLAEAAE